MQEQINNTAIKIFLVSFCTLEDICFLKTIYELNDILVGVDQGTKHLLESDLIPHFIIGDFDSFTLPTNFALKSKIITLEKEKDYSDLEYALNNLPFLLDSELKFSDYEVIIINNMQGRIDHILSTLFLMKKRKNISIQSATQKIFFIDKKIQISLPINTTISLIPMSHEVKNITTKGLYYPLCNESLFLHQSRGISNLSLESLVQIEFHDGELLCVINNNM